MESTSGTLCVVVQRKKSADGLRTGWFKQNVFIKFHK